MAGGTGPLTLPTLAGVEIAAGSGADQRSWNIVLCRNRSAPGWSADRPVDFRVGDEGGRDPLGERVAEVDDQLARGEMPVNVMAVR
jgi:hypothetical protein